MNLGIRLQELSEHDLTVELIIPLFRALNYKTLTYHGGPHEKGKDLICWRTDQFGDRILAVVQVKKFKFSASSSSTNSFAALVTQLQQARETAIPHAEGVEQLPNEVIFISPYPLDVRALEARFEQFASLRARGVRVFDGQKLEQLLAAHIPNVLQRLLGVEFVVQAALSRNLSNPELQSALMFRPSVDNLSIYSDLALGIGSQQMRLFAYERLNPSQLNLIIKENSKELLQNAIEAAKEICVTSVVKPTFSEAVEKAEQQKRVWEGEANTRTLDSIRSVISQCSDSSEELFEDVRHLWYDRLPRLFGLEPPKGSASRSRSRDSLADSDSDWTEELTEGTKRRSKPFQHDFWQLRTTARLLRLEARQTETGITPANIDRLQEYMSRILSTLSSLEETVCSVRGTDDFYTAHGAFHPSVFLDAIKSIRFKMEGWQSSIKSLTELVKSRAPEPTISMTVLGDILADGVDRDRRWLIQVATAISSGQIPQRDLEHTLRHAHTKLRQLETIFTLPDFVKAIGLDDTVRISMPTAMPTLSLPTSNIFKTGIDIALYGDAGAGKTTTLQAYAHAHGRTAAKNELPLFLPLAKLVEHAPKTPDDDTSLSAIDRFGIAVYAFIVSHNVDISPEELTDYLRQQSRVTWLLDGVDEITRSAPWLVDAIPLIKSKYPNSQIIVSSRFEVQVATDSSFVPLTLLPFSRRQLSDFIKKWFVVDSKTTQKLESHLDSHPELVEVVRSPLLATVLCALAQHDVPLPSTEVALYEERFRLLLGHYDAAKGVARLRSHHTFLQSVAQKVAFGLHNNNRQSSDRSELIQLACERSAQGYDRKKIGTAIDELIDPCNVLVPMDEKGTLGFGHLRYQEYLVAREILSNRSISYSELMGYAWWRQVMVLYGKMIDDIKHLVETEMQEGRWSQAKYETLYAMIEGRSSDDRRIHLPRLEALHRRRQRQN